MIICHRCGKENQDVYKFCLGCGAELQKEAPAQAGAQPGDQGQNVGMMKTMMADVDRNSSSNMGQMQGGQGPAGGHGGGGFPPPGGGPHVPGHAGHAGQPMPQQPQGGPPPQQAQGPKVCPQCGTEVPANFKFCGACGFRMDDAGGPPAPQAQPQGQPQPAPQAQPTGGLLTLIRPDGSEGGTHRLNPGENLIGRDHGPAFESDGYLSPTHAVLVVDGQRAVVRDLDSLNGVFVRMTEEEEVEPGQILRIGQELLRFDLIDPPAPLEDGTEVMGSPNPGYWGKITVVIGKEVDGSAYPLLGESVTMGRERGDINFPDDGYVSGLHARLSTRGGKVYIADLGSSNGTFVKVKSERELGDDSYVLLGQQLFRLQLG